MKKLFKKIFWGFGIFAALVIRILVAPWYFHVDILSNAGWGEWVANNGTSTLFRNNVWVYSWPTQLPLIDLIYGWCFDIYRYLIIYLIRLGFLLDRLGIGLNNYRGFVNWFGGPLSSDVPFKIGFLFSIKILPIISDLLIALVLWKIAKFKKIKNDWVWPMVYLLSPFAIYVSAFWGQYDQMAFLLLLLAFLSLKKFSVLSPILFSLSLGIKPTGAIFIPFYIYQVIKNKSWWKGYGVGIVLAIILNIYMIGLFAGGENWISFTRGKLLSSVINKGEYRLSVNSYNFWHMIAGDKAVNANDNFIFMPFAWWGNVAIILINLWAIIMDIKKNKMWEALTIIGVGSWLFGMNMLERYLFAGVGFGLVATIYNPKLWSIWIPLSGLFFVNLYKNWWQPEWLWMIRYFCENWEIGARFVIPMAITGLFIWWIKGYLVKNRIK